MLSAKYVQRQITVIPVVTVIEAPLLPAIQRIISGIHIQNDLLGSSLLGLQKQFHQQRIDALRVHHDLLGLGFV